MRVSCPRDVHNIVSALRTGQQQQSRPLACMERIKRSPIDRGGDFHRPAKLFRVRRNIERVQSLHVGHIISLDLFGARNHIQSLAGRIDDRSSCDAHDRVHVAQANVVARDGENIGRRAEVNLAKRL
jgi:hypothetical protein